jgi:hypothetical protein
LRPNSPNGSPASNALGKMRRLVEIKSNPMYLRPPTTLESETTEIPTVAQVIASMNAGARAKALKAAEQHYWETALDCGCVDEAARAWATNLMSHLRVQIEQMREGQLPASTFPQDEYGLTEKILTKVIGALLILMASPLILFIWVGLKVERADPAITMRTTGGLTTYSFVLGSGWISSLVRRAELRALPSLWHLVNGDTVLRLKDLAWIIYPSVRKSSA